MEVIDFIHNTEMLQSTCCLCFNASKNTINIDELIEILDEYKTDKVTLRYVTKYLFASFDLLLNQACDSCADLILKIYILIKRATFKVEAMVNLANRISEEIVNKKDKHTSKLFINMQEHMLIRSKKGFDTDLSTLDDEYSFKCKDSCTVEKNEEFKSQINRHDVNKSLVCVICGKIFKKTSSLNTHLSSHETIECPYCSKKLKNNSHSKIHIKSHLNSTKRITKTCYKCDDCGHESRNKIDLSSHMYKHHLNVRPYVCEICQKSFYSQRNLNEHVLTHANTKMNTCELCGEQFSCKPALNNHLKLHAGYRPFKCDLCNHSFVTVGRRTEHTKRKHGEKQFSCEMCEKKYCLKKALNRHIKTTHKG